MRVVPVDLDGLRAKLRSSATGLACLLDGADVYQRIPRLEWTVGDVATHLALGIAAYREMAVGSYDFTTVAEYVSAAATPGERGARINRALLDRRAVADPDGLRHAIVEETERFLDATESIAPDRWFATWTGYPMDLFAATAAMLGEQLVHGFDIARALRAPWPIDPDAARLVHAGTADLTPHYLAPDVPDGARLTVEVRVRDWPRYTIAIRGRTAAIHPETSAPAADCHVSAEPVALLLTNYRRIGQLRPFLTGAIRTGGRRPWRARQLQRYLTPP